MSDDDSVRSFEKITALLMFAVWSAVFVGLSFDAIAVSRPEYWGVFSAIVFAIIGKLWDIEVQKYLPTGGGTGSDDK